VLVPARPPQPLRQLMISSKADMACGHPCRKGGGAGLTFSAFLNVD